MKFVEFRFKNKAEENGCGHNGRLGGQLIDKVERFKYFN